MIAIEGLFERTVIIANPFLKSFLEFLYRDIKRFAESPAKETEVLCFPKMHTYLRYLIQMVAELFSLATSSMGSGTYRITVVSSRLQTANMEHLRELVFQYCENHEVDQCYEPYQYPFDFTTMS